MDGMNRASLGKVSPFPLNQAIFSSEPNTSGKRKLPTKYFVESGQHFQQTKYSWQFTMIVVTISYCNIISTPSDPSTLVVVELKVSLNQLLQRITGWKWQLKSLLEYYTKSSMCHRRLSQSQALVKYPTRMRKPISLRNL